MTEQSEDVNFQIAKIIGNMILTTPLVFLEDGASKEEALQGVFAGVAAGLEEVFLQLEVKDLQAKKILTGLIFSISESLKEKRIKK